MKNMTRYFALVLGIMLLSACSNISSSSRSATPLPEYAYTPVEAHALMLENPEVVLIDVREPGEVRFDGNIENTQIHVPMMFVDTNNWNDNASTYAMRMNENFLEEMLQELKNRNVATSQPIMFICRSGIRGRMAAEQLRNAGYSQSYYILGGFNGYDPEGYPGWRPSGLPWVTELNRDVAWGGHRRSEP